MYVSVVSGYDRRRVARRYEEPESEALPTQSDQQDAKPLQPLFDDFPR
jgi:hypothetical protein